MRTVDRMLVCMRCIDITHTHTHTHVRVSLAVPDPSLFCVLVWRCQTNTQSHTYAHIHTHTHTHTQFDSVSTSSNDLQSLEEADPSNKLLPNGLLPEFYESGPVMFTTSDREKYKCVLPEVVGLGEERKKVRQSIMFHHCED